MEMTHPDHLDVTQNVLAFVQELTGEHNPLEKEPYEGEIERLQALPRGGERDIELARVTQVAIQTIREMVEGHIRLRSQNREKVYYNLLHLCTYLGEQHSLLSAVLWPELNKLLQRRTLHGRYKKEYLYDQLVRVTLALKTRAQQRRRQ